MYIENVKKARENIKDVIVKTPILHSKIFSDLCNNIVYMKCENLQLTGAYKLRGALNKIKGLTDYEKSQGVVCSSAGNHAQGVAYASSLIGVDATIVMPKTTPYLKVQSTKNYGGNVVLEGNCYDDAYNEAKRIEAKENKVFIHPFNDIDIIYGQGTIALEILEDIPNIDCIICPIGGGGLISGISLVAKEINPSIKIIGVQSEGAAAMANSFKNKRLTPLTTVNTIADGIAVKTPGDKTFEIIKDHVDEIITVSDAEIVDAFLLLTEKHKLIAEASGVVSLAALKKLNFTGKRVCSVISGGNIDMLTISTLINNGLVSGGRLFCFSTEVPNTPGQLLKLSQLLVKENANIVSLDHDKFKAINRINNVLVEITVETNGDSHIERIVNALENEGYSIRVMY